MNDARNGIAVALCALVIAGCISLEEQGIPLDAPVALRPAARDLVGKQASDVVVETRDTVAKGPFDSQSVRRTAEQTRPAVVSIYTKTKIPVRVSLLPIHLPEDEVRDQMCTSCDWYPTILKLCELPAAQQKVSGKTLLPVLASA